MSSFEPFEEFRDQLEEGRELSESHKSSQRDRDPEVIHSYLDEDGRWIDCIRTETQPGLRGGGAPAAPPRFIEMPRDRDTAQSAPAASSGSIPNRVDRLGNAMVCPDGCIPVRRADRNRPGSTGSSERFFQKGPGGGAMPPTS